jgi:tetrahydromethanopterin S-methyltransferase subunit G
MEDEVIALKAHIKELESRIEWAAEQLHSLANEQVHRKHGCLYSEVEPDDLEEVVDILTGKLVR